MISIKVSEQLPCGEIKTKVFMKDQKLNGSHSLISDQWVIALPIEERWRSYNRPLWLSVCAK